VVHPFLTGNDMLGRKSSTPSRYAIDLNHCNDLFEAMQYTEPLETLKAQDVLLQAEENAAEELKKSGKSTGPRQTHAKRWWKFWRGREEMMDVIKTLPRYIVCVRHTKRPIFQFISPKIHPNDALQVFPLSGYFNHRFTSNGSRHGVRHSKLTSDTPATQSSTVSPGRKARRASRSKRLRRKPWRCGNCAAR